MLALRTARLLPACVALLLGGCGSEDGPQSGPLAEYAPPGEEVAAGVRAQLEGLDPAKDGWPTEVLHELAKPRLSEFVERMAEGETRALGRHLSPRFESTTVLLPSELATTYDVDGVRVRQARVLPREPHDSEALHRLVHELLALFDGEDEHALHTKVKIYTTELEPGPLERFTTMALVRLDGPAAEGGLLQVNMEWRILWDHLSDYEVAMRRIELALYDEIRTPGALFAEVTDHVLGGIPRYEEEFLRGVDAYHFRLDRLDGNVYAGQVGVTVGDVNGDGLDDVYVPQHGGLPNRLLLHLADGRLRDVSEEAGVAFLEDSQSALILDLDDDGDQDLAVANGPAIVLAYNDGGGAEVPHFTLRRRPLAAGPDKIKSMAAADWDQDGDLDLYACVYDKRGPLGTVPYPYHDAVNGPPNVAWRNDGVGGGGGVDGRWTDVTEELGLSENNVKFSYAAIWEDFDEDGYLDLYVVNDFGRNNYYRNDGTGHFRDVAVEVGADDMAAGMGVCAGDVDGDGDVDLYVTNMWSSAGRRIASQEDRFKDGQDAELRDDYLRHARGNTLLLNDGTGHFEDVTEQCGAMLAGWAWGAVAFDANNDGLLDLYSPNGFLTGSDPDDL